MKGSIEAAAFDLDGTLYPNSGLYFRLIPFLFAHWRLLWAFGKARDRIRAEQEQRGPAAEQATDTPFYDYQAQLTAAILGEAANGAVVKQKIERLIYRGWEPHFKRIALFPHARETLAALRQAGIKLALLSDFPPEAKLVNLGLDGCWDAVLCSERTGAIKPDPRPFAALADALHTAPEKILYVGNSRRYDVLGARRAGMKTALVCRRPARALSQTPPPDCAFHDYRQLRDFVLQ